MHSLYCQRKIQHDGVYEANCAVVSILSSDSDPSEFSPEEWLMIFRSLIQRNLSQPNCIQYTNKLDLELENSLISNFPVEALKDNQIVSQLLLPGAISGMSATATVTAASNIGSSMKNLNGLVSPTPEDEPLIKSGSSPLPPHPAPGDVAAASGFTGIAVPSSISSVTKKKGRKKQCGVENSGLSGGEGDPRGLSLLPKKDGRTKEARQAKNLIKQQQHVQQQQQVSEDQSSQQAAFSDNDLSGLLDEENDGYDEDEEIQRILNEESEHEVESQKIDDEEDKQEDVYQASTLRDELAESWEFKKLSRRKGKCRLALSFFLYLFLLFLPLLFVCTQRLLSSICYLASNILPPYFSEGHHDVILRSRGGFVGH